MRLLRAALLCALPVPFVVMLAGSATMPVEADSEHETRNLRGWRIVVDERLLESQSGIGADALELLDHHLYEVTRAIPTKALNELREVPIWLGVEDENGRHPCACYHPSEKWLRDNGYDPAKAKSVDIANAATFLKWTKDQPSMVLHELSHAYHDLVLGYDHPALLDAYQAAVAGGAYDEVLRNSGKREAHYALNTVQEYFAEGTEAWFGTNDFYPFVRAELREHDPVLADILAEVWGEER